MRRSLAALALAAAACTGGPSTEPVTELPRPLTDAEAALIAADNAFAFRLLNRIAATDEAPNLFISPLSVGMALGMAYNGAAGRTREAMATTLGLQGLSLDEVNAGYRSVIDLLRGLDPTVEFTIANSIWHRLQITLAPAFLERAATHFDATVQGLDFADPAAAATINDWVSDQTRGRIDEIVTPPIPEETIAYLVNAIYFKGSWTSRFDRDRTASGTFLRTDGTTRSVPLMRTGDPIPLLVAYDEGIMIGELPYGGGAYRMTIVVPQDPAALEGLVAGLTQDQWNAWIASLDSTDLDVVLPKFTMEYERELATDLAALGMEVAFCDNPAADFTAMYPDGGACISAVKHKTFVLVDEEGTEAAAVTSVEVGVTSAPPMFVVDRPFLFAIREALSGTILFMGAITDPGL
jgi:serpin B